MGKKNTSESDIQNPHDVGYKYLLSSKKIVMELLRSFVDEGWVDKIDESEMIPVNKSFVLHDFKEIESDVVYKVKIKDQDVIFYILMELQSTVDFQMPYRLLRYMTEIWRYLLRKVDENEKKRKDYRLPVIVPIVLYNGKYHWTAKMNFKEYLSGYEIFEEYALDFKYILIDVNRYSKEDLIELSNVIGSAFLLDQKCDIIELKNRIKTVCNLMGKLESNQLQLFITWVNKIIVTHFSTESFDEIVKMIKDSAPEEAEQVISNFAENLQKMQDAARKEEKIEIAENMLRQNLSEQLIATVTKLSIKEVKKIRDQMDNSE